MKKPKHKNAFCDEMFDVADVAAKHQELHELINFLDAEHRNFVSEELFDIPKCCHARRASSCSRIA